MVEGVDQTDAAGADGGRGDGPHDRSNVMLREFLSGTDAPCPGCGYNLRGLTGRRCPECNQSLVLRVGLEFPRQGAFIAGLVGWTLALGFCGLLLVWVVVMLVTRGPGPGFADIVPLIVGALVSGVGTWRWLGWRARLARMEPGVRRWVVAGVWFVAMTCPVWFMVTVR